MLVTYSLVYCKSQYSFVCGGFAQQPDMTQSYLELCFTCDILTNDSGQRSHQLHSQVETRISYTAPLILLRSFVNVFDGLQCLSVSVFVTVKKRFSVLKNDHIGHSPSTQPLMRFRVYYSHSHGSIITRHQKMGRYIHRVSMWYVYGSGNEWLSAHNKQEHLNF